MKAITKIALTAAAVTGIAFLTVFGGNGRQVYKALAAGDLQIVHDYGDGNVVVSDGTSNRTMSKEEYEEQKSQQDQQNQQAVPAGGNSTVAAGGSSSGGNGGNTSGGGSNIAVPTLKASAPSSSSVSTYVEEVPHEPVKPVRSPEAIEMDDIWKQLEQIAADTNKEKVHFIYSKVVNSYPGAFIDALGKVIADGKSIAIIDKVGGKPHVTLILANTAVESVEWAGPDYLSEQYMDLTAEYNALPDTMTDSEKLFTILSK